MANIMIAQCGRLCFERLLRRGLSTARPALTAEGNTVKSANVHPSLTRGAHRLESRLLKKAKQVADGLTPDEDKDEPARNTQGESSQPQHGHLDREYTLLTMEERAKAMPRQMLAATDATMTTAILDLSSPEASHSSSAGPAGLNAAKRSEETGLASSPSLSGPRIQSMAMSAPMAESERSSRLPLSPVGSGKSRLRRMNTAKDAILTEMEAGKFGPGPAGQQPQLDFGEDGKTRSREHYHRVFSLTRAKRSILGQGGVKEADAVEEGLAEDRWPFGSGLLGRSHPSASSAVEELDTKPVPIEVLVRVHLISYVLPLAGELLRVLSPFAGSLSRSRPQPILRLRLWRLPARGPRQPRV